jgi:hypothetical protein
LLRPTKSQIVVQRQVVPCPPTRQSRARTTVVAFWRMSIVGGCIALTNGRGIRLRNFGGCPERLEFLNLLSRIFIPKSAGEVPVDFPHPQRYDSFPPSLVGIIVPIPKVMISPLGKAERWNILKKHGAVPKHLGPKQPPTARRRFFNQFCRYFRWPSWIGANLEVVTSCSLLRFQNEEISDLSPSDRKFGCIHI